MEGFEIWPLAEGIKLIFFWGFAVNFRDSLNFEKLFAHLIDFWENVLEMVSEWKLVIEDRTIWNSSVQFSFIPLS